MSEISIAVIPFVKDSRKLFCITVTALLDEASSQLPSHWTGALALILFVVK
jgi:hypothetical protein